MAHLEVSGHEKNLTRQIGVWRDSLLNLNRRQRQLYFKHSPNSTLELEGGAARLADGLSVGRRLALVAELEETIEGSDRRSVRRRAPSSRKIRTVVALDKNDAQLTRAVRNLQRQSDSAFIDRGVHILYLALGMINWVDPTNGEDVSSPILLVPVAIERDVTRGSLSIVVNEGDRQINPAVIVKFARDLGIDLGGLEPDDPYAEIIAAAERSLQRQRGWTLSDRAVVSTFTFHKEAMYRDLEVNIDKVTASPLIQLLALGGGSKRFDGFQFVPVDEASIDNTQPPEELHAILDADSSQRRCIDAAVGGHSFVMDGPPGSGKSQTIANVITELMHRGKSVLFVSEKAAALDVVRRRLEAASLGPFILELHSHKATRKTVATELGAAVRSRPIARSPLSAAELHRVTKTRCQLTGYAEAMNEIRQPLQESLHQVLGELGRLRGLTKYPITNALDFADLSTQDLASIEALAIDLRDCWEPISMGEAFVWAGANLKPRTSSVESRKLAQTHAVSLESLLRSANSVCDQFQLPAAKTLEDAEQLLRLLQIVEKRPQLPKNLAGADAVDAILAGWLCAGEVAEVEDAFEQLRAAHNQAITAESELNEWLRVGTLDRDAAKALRHAHLVCNESGPSWPLPKQLGLEDLDNLREDINGLLAPLHACRTDAEELAELFGFDPNRLTVPRLRDLLGLAELAYRSERPDKGWLNPLLQEQLQKSHRVLERHVTDCTRLGRDLNEVFAVEILELPLAEMVQRIERNRGTRRLTQQSRRDRKTLKEVTVGGRLNRASLDRLGEALAWQRSYAALQSAEEIHREYAGVHYRGLETDFRVLRAALENSHRAIELAKDELDAQVLEANLAAGSSPDPKIPGLVGPITTFLEMWDHAAAAVFGQSLNERLERLPLIEVAQWLAQAVGSLQRSSSALRVANRQVGRPISLSDVEALLGANDRCVHALESMETVMASKREVLGCFASFAEHDIDAGLDQLRWVTELRDAWPIAIPQVVAFRLLESESEAGKLQAEVAGATESLRALLDLFERPRRTDLGEVLSVLEEGARLSRQLAVTAEEQLSVWHELDRVREALEAFGLRQLLDDLAASAVAPEDLPTLIKQSVLTAWVECIWLRDEERLSPSGSTARDELVGQFQELDRKLVQSRAAEVITECVSRRPKVLVGPSAMLVKQAELSRRHKPIRDIIGGALDIIHDLKPCFMMSPLSVSQYLPADIGFDVVIFDEASQVMPEDAVNCLYRAQQVIVAGDQNQLPPTDFFISVDGQDTGDQDLDELSDFKSLLDLCKAQGFPSLPLRWHYRSRHEHLIAFSNHLFYGGRLQTFPSPHVERGDLGVKSILVDGIYRRGTRRDNPLEATTVVDRVLVHLAENPDDSLGVVAFSAAQEEAVLLEIERRAAAHPELAELLISEDRLEGFFVKNLENVQGDERDIIVFTVGYGRDENGRFTAVIPTLNGEGGWKRLNVAVTRARKRVEIVHSVRPEDFPTGAKHGLLHLRNYIDYAMRGPAALQLVDGVGGVQRDSLLAQDVMQVITSWGYEVVPNVGTASLRLDVGVKHPKQPSRFLIGVECDGEAYYASRAARDRDRLRGQVLVGLGWALHRIWGTAWYRNRDEEEARLRRAIESAINTPHAIEPSAPPTSGIEVQDELIDVERLPDWAVPFTLPRAVRVRPALRGGDGLTGSKAHQELDRYLKIIVEAEAPIHRDLLEARLRSDWGIGRLGARARTQLAGAYDRLQSAGFIHYDGHFFRRARDERVGRVIRVGGRGTSRKIGHVPPEEIQLALWNTVRDARSITRGDAKSFVARLFGWFRIGPGIDAVLDQALDRLIAEGWLEESNSLLREVRGR